MERQPFTLQELTIQKMPGLPHGLKPYKDLSPAINIIAGPNASGKSSTARAIQKLIWRKKTDGIRASGHIQIADDPWDIRIDSNNIVVQRDGKEDALKGLPAVEEKNRYMLALHELIKADEGDLAKQIIKESIGGYDLEQAREKLSYSSTIKNRGVAEFKKYEDENNNVKEQQEHQKKIKKEEKRLDDLEKQKEVAEEAEKQKELYDRVVKYLREKIDYKHKEDQYKAFPQVLEKATGEEYTRIEELESDIDDAVSTIEGAQEIVDEQKNILRQLDIPENGVAPKDLLEIEERVERLEKLDEKLSKLEEEKVKQESLRKVALKSIDQELETSEWTGLNLKDIEDLDKYFEKAHRTASTKRFLEKEIEELERQKDEGVFEKSTIQKGIESLSLWLQEQRVGSNFPNWVIIAILIVSILAIVTIFFWWQGGAIGLLLMIGLSLYGLWKSKQLPKNERISVREEDYQETGLPPIDSWNPESVKNKLKDLVEKLQESSWQERIKQELKKRFEQLSDLQKQIKDVEKNEEELRSKISSLPELPFEDPQNYKALYWFFVHAQKWQDANAEVLALAKEWENESDRLEEELEKCSTLFKQYNAGSPKDAVEAKAQFEYLEQQEENRQNAEKELKNQSGIIEKARKLIKEKRDKLEKIYGKLDIEVGKKDEVKLLLNQLEEYEAAKEDFGVSQKLFSDKKALMENHSRYEEERSQIEHLNLDEAEDKLQEYKEKSDGLIDIRDEITQIKTKIESLKAGHSLEDALKKRDESLLDLQNLYEENISSITGNLLVDQLKQEVREQNRPKVFHEANHLFNRITKGRYEIKIGEKDEPEFRAYDTVQKVGKTLEELSTGTRIQLLLSVRMAFVETQESSIKLPILADELLGNSDDMRAKAIIEALTQISNDGRQVFYFTAQADEVTKWDTYLSEDNEVDYQIFELQEVMSNGTLRENASNGLGEIALLQKVPKPDGLTYEEYADALEIDRFDVILDNITQIHLWYLLNDKNLLYNCLKSGINNWGQLKSFLKHGGHIEGLGEEEIAQIREKVQFIEHFQNLYQQGRPKPIDRSILESTDAVSPHFIDEVSEKLKELNGNPADLLTALENSEVSGFRSNKIEELESYLFEKGFIDDRDPLDLDEIKTRVQAHLSNLNMSPSEADNILNRLLSD